MKLKEHYGLIAILIIIIYYLGRILFQFVLPQPMIRLAVIFSPLWYVFALLLVGAIISIFVKYKFNWIFIGLPFLWLLALPLSNPTSPQVMLGVIFQFFGALFQGAFIFPIFLSLLLLCLIIFYLIMSSRKEFDKKLETYFSIVFLILFFISLLKF